MQGARTLSIFACALAFQIFLVAAIADVRTEPDKCRTPRPPLAEKLGLQDLPELHEAFGLAVAPVPRVMAEDFSRGDYFGCVTF